VPGNLKLVAPEVDPKGRASYLGNVVARAKQSGIKPLVFVSGAARLASESEDERFPQRWLPVPPRPHAERAACPPDLFRAPNE
ncbi:MAG: hypothetical protein ABSH22_13655, partial [Tepidisphaeraceae bacterium]